MCSWTQVLWKWALECQVPKVFTVGCSGWSMVVTGVCVCGGGRELAWLFHLLQVHRLSLPPHLPAWPMGGACLVFRKVWVTAGKY